jgi:hypothetical protein
MALKFFLAELMGINQFLVVINTFSIVIFRLIGCETSEYI